MNANTADTINRANRRPIQRGVLRRWLMPQHIPDGSGGVTVHDHGPQNGPDRPVLLTLVADADRCSIQGSVLSYGATGFPGYADLTVHGQRSFIQAATIPTVASRDSFCQARLAFFLTSIHNTHDEEAKTMDLSKVKEYLVEEGYRPVLDEDGDINFKSDGKFYVIDSYKDDEHFIRLIAPNIWEIESEAELKQALIQANQATCAIKSAKVFVIENRENVWASIEMFVADVEAFIAVFPRCLHVLAAALSLL